MFHLISQQMEYYKGKGNKWNLSWYYLRLLAFNMKISRFFDYPYEIIWREIVRLLHCYKLETIMHDTEKTKQHPAWLKAMQNGAIGEARAKAFLLDRFWVLERSVDIDGADFIIQRRLTGRNLLDREAPRLGVIQVKYFGTHTTQHFVHLEYVVDENNEPRNEFFLLCFTGNEESPRSFLISAKDIFEKFPKATKNDNDGFAISYSLVTSSSDFAIINPKLALDRIEKRLEFAEFSKNRHFISWALPSSKTELSAISPEYSEQIDNWWGDIPTGFEEIKRSARSAIFDVEEILNFLQKLTQETDPLKAEEIIDDIRYNCRDGLGGWSISLPDNLYDEDFFAVCRKHKEVYESLKNDGLLNSFLNIKNELRDRLVQDLENHFPVGANVAHFFSFSYNPDNFKILSFNSEFIEKEDFLKKYPKSDSRSIEGITKHSRGRIEYAWFPGSYSSINKDEKIDMHWFRLQNFWLYYRCLDTIFSLKYYDEFDL